ncbi:MAG: 30S ribosomal protein S2, partial [Patescibacteria group bacterium]
MQTTSLKPQKTENRNISDSISIEKMFEAGAHYGYGKSRRHPSVSSYIYDTKNNGDIIDLKKTSVMLEHATEFIKSLGAQNKIILFVGTKPEAR